MKRNKVQYLSKRKKSSKKRIQKGKREVQRVLRPVRENKSANPPIRALLMALKMKKANFDDSRIGKALSEKFKLSSSEIDYILKRIGGLLKITKKNPVENKTLIYDSIETITAKKGKSSLWPSQRFKHEFKDKSHAQIFGLSDGSLLIRGKKPLWKNINYPHKKRGD